jgi:hypothetical protein
MGTLGHSGTWSTYGTGTPMLMFSWDTTGLATAPTFASDGRSMEIDTAAGGHEAILAKATGTP